MNPRSVLRSVRLNPMRPEGEGAALAVLVVRLVFIVCLGIISWAPSQLAASDTGTSSVILEKSAIDLLNDGHYNRAASIFADLASRFPASPGHDSWLYNLARSKYHLGKFESAKRDFAVGITRYGQNPDSRSEYTSYRWFFLGNIAVREGDATTAAHDYVRAYALAGDERLMKLSIESMLSLVENSGDSLSSFMRFVDDVYSQVDVSAIQSKSALIAALNGVTPENETSDTRNAARDNGRDLPTVTLALPMSGKLEQYGKRIERGARLANFVSREDSSPIIYLELEDTQGSPSLAVEISQRAEQGNSLALIGPLTSEEAVAVSASLTCSNLPALAPAANQNNFAKLSQTMFQLSPSPSTIGRRLAEYAFLQMPVATAATLAQNSPSDKEMAAAFAKRFTELGGEMVAVEIFPPSATDFGKFGERIKTRFLGGYDDEVELIGENGDTLDFDEAPVEIGCIFVGATVRQLQLILPQINYHNIKTTLIGSDGLATPSVWDLPLQNVKGIIFTSWRTQDAENSAFRSFAQMYRYRYGESPDRLAALGYDALRMIIEGLRNGARSQSAMSQYLESLTLHKGASGDIAFGVDHINRELSIYTVVDKLPKRLSWNPPRIIEAETDRRRN
jgi:ABC-type branched-subunit amino acid transport system substrate-binding protein